MSDASEPYVSVMDRIRKINADIDSMAKKSAIELRQNVFNNPQENPELYRLMFPSFVDCMKIWVRSLRARREQRRQV